MSKRNLTVYFAAITLVASAALILRSRILGPITEPRPADRIRAERTAAAPSGSASSPDPRAALDKDLAAAGNGIVEPRDREIKVAAAIAGRVAEVLVQEGQHVERGASLVRFDSDVERASLAAAAADVKGARAELARLSRGLRREDVDAITFDADAAKARAEQSSGSLARIELLAQNKAVSADELDRARRQADSDGNAARAADARKRAAVAGSRAEDVAASAARLGAAEAREEQARAALERLTVKAPAAGEILQIKVRPGEYVNPGGAEPLLLLGDTSSLRVRMDVDERDIGKVAVGAAAFVTVDAFPRERFTGKVAQIGRRMGRKNLRTDDPTERIDTKVLEAIVDLDPTPKLLPGLRVVSYVRAQ